MTISPAYLDYVIAAMGRVTTVTYRRIFNGAGIYHCGVQFAILINDHIYFRADDLSRPLYEQKSMSAFRPRGASHLESEFFQLPDEVLTNPSELKHWMRIAVEAACNGNFDEEITIQPSARTMQLR